MTRYYLIEMYEDGRLKGQSQGKFHERKKGNLSTVLGRPLMDKKEVIYRPIIEYLANNERKAKSIIRERDFEFLRGAVFNKENKKYHSLTDFDTLKSFIREFYF